MNLESDAMIEYRDVRAVDRAYDAVGVAIEADQVVEARRDPLHIDRPGLTPWAGPRVCQPRGMGKTNVPWC